MNVNRVGTATRYDICEEEKNTYREFVAIAHANIIVFCEGKRISDKDTQNLFKFFARKCLIKKLIANTEPELTYFGFCFFNGQ